MSEASLLDEAILYFESQGVPKPERALVLGSGFLGFAAEIQDARAIALSEVPNWPVPAVEGQGGSVIFGSVGGVTVACLTGRAHLYEGWDADEVVRPVRTLARMGVTTFLLTNAAGGIAEQLRPGDLVVLEDHLNLTATSPLVGEHEPELGPRFPDQTRVWDPALRAVLHAADPEAKRGVYAGLLGPSYETPAEVRMLRRLGADVVGMSTVLEAIALHAMGARVAGVSLVSNLAAGMADTGTSTSHDEVLAAGRAAQARLTKLLVAFCIARP
jgi:purine-nucleoside phosphorylase